MPFIDQRKDESAELREQRNPGTSLKIWENTQSEPVFPPQQPLQLSRTHKEGQSESERSEGELEARATLSPTRGKLEAPDRLRDLRAESMWAPKQESGERASSQSCWELSKESESEKCLCGVPRQERASRLPPILPTQGGPGEAERI